MKLNVKLFVKLIDMLLSNKVTADRFDFTEINGSMRNDCGCTLYHALENKLLIDNVGYRSQVSLPINDYENIFGDGDESRHYVHGKQRPTKEEVAQVMEDYLTAVEMGMVKGVEV